MSDIASASSRASSRPLASAILAAGIVLAAAVGSWTFYSVRSFDNVLQVTGSARKTIASDTMKWTGQFTRTVDRDDLQSGYAQMKKDRTAVLSFLKKNKIDEKGVIISTVFMDQNWGAPPERAQREFILRQSVEVRSTDVEGLTKIAKNIDELINQGVLFSTQMLEYTVSKLPELRVELLKDAVKDARARAASIAESDGKSVGSLKSASIGVVQVLAPNSTAVDDYGAYDTSSVEKEVMVTVRAAFQLR